MVRAASGCPSVSRIEALENRLADGNPPSLIAQTSSPGLIFALCSIALLPSCTAQGPARPAIVDLNGRTADLFSPSHRATVLLFITNDCPISNAYAPEIHRLCDQYTRQDIAFYLVYADPALSAAD